jgi:hypothetical protein
MREQIMNVVKQQAQYPSSATHKVIEVETLPFSKDVRILLSEYGVPKEAIVISKSTARLLAAELRRLAKD